ncbi:MAG: sulfatase [Gemmataceae bacterium]
MKFLLTLLLLAPAERPNVVLINADDLGINDLGCYGRKDHTTPHLDRLAAQGLRFTSAYCAQPICSPSRAALMTGKAPARLHLTTYLPGRPDTKAQKLLHPKIRQQLPLEERTIAEVFQEAGYTTACVGKWHLGGKGFLPRQQGFDIEFVGKANTTPSETEGGKGEYELTRQALRVLDANRDRPFLLYLAHNNPHIPLAAKADLVEKHKGAFNPVYAACIETLDDAVGRVLTKLDELKLAEHTIVVFTSDNGGVHVPELKEDPPTHNTPFRAGKGFVYEGGLRVPLIVRWPGKIKPGVTGKPVVNTDFLPTLAELAGLSPPEGLDGVSFAPLLLGKGELKARTVYWHFPHYNNQGGRPAGAVREGDWKLVAHYDAGAPELYNLAADPGETTNLLGSQMKRATAMKLKLLAWRERVKAQENSPNPDFDETLYRRLYLDVDVSKLKPARTAAEMTPKLAAWRKDMDEAVTRRKR